MQKSADAFRTISEVADDLSLPQHVLRFWETRFPQIRPLKRAGGRRYYRPADVSLLKAIRQLLYDDGYTIKGVQRLLKEQGVKGLSAGPPPSEFDWESNVGPHAVSDVPSGSADFAVELHDEPSQPGAESLGSGSSLHEHRHAIETTLATVDECKRILDALLTPQR